MAEFDVVIIGSGLGSLECAAMLAREGMGVCVLEKNQRLGGCLQSFRRGGRSLDTGMHYVGSLDEGQILNQYFRYLGIMDSLRLHRLDEEAFDTVVFGGEEYGLGMGYERFAANLKERFPAQGDRIGRFCALLESVGGTMGVENLRRGAISVGAMPYMQRSAHGALCDAFDDPVLRHVLAGTSLLYGSDAAKTSLYHYGMINHSFIESAHRLVGGSQQLADALAATIAAHGGVVRPGSGVKTIRVEGGRVVGVEVADGEFIPARHVISGLHPAVTFSLVEKTPVVRKAHLSRLRSLENSPGTFSVYLMMKPGAMPYINRNFYIHGTDDPWKCVYDPAADTPRSVLLSMQIEAADQRCADVVSLLCTVPSDMFAPWEETLPGRRGAEYEELKSRLADRIVEFAAHRFPALRNGVERIYTTSPLSWRDYTASPGGSSYGIVKDWASPLTTLIPVRTRLENLLLTGQNLNVHGALGVTVTAALTCSKLLGAEYLAKKIGNA